jgi:DNA-binding CsgD family transcriptional regulator
VAHIEFLGCLRLVREALSSVLLDAGFTVFCEMGEHDSDTIVVIDLDLKALHAQKARGVKVVAMVHEAGGLKMDPDDIAALSGILTYDLSLEAFVRSFRLIRRGGRVFPPDLALGRKPATPASTVEGRPARVQLSPRERDVLLHLVAGHSNKTIARYLGMAESTVKVHLKHLLRKINVDNRTQAAIWTLANLPGLSATARRSD